VWLRGGAEMRLNHGKIVSVWNVFTCHAFMCEHMCWYMCWYMCVFV